MLVNFGSRSFTTWTGRTRSKLIFWSDTVRGRETSLKDFNLQTVSPLQFDPTIPISHPFYSSNNTFQMVSTNPSKHFGDRNCAWLSKLSIAWRNQTSSFKFQRTARRNRVVHGPGLFYFDENEIILDNVSI